MKRTVNHSVKITTQHINRDLLIAIKSYFYFLIYLCSLYSHLIEDLIEDHI